MRSTRNRPRAVHAARAVAVMLACAPLAAAGCGGSSGRSGDAGAPVQQARGVRPLPSPQGAASSGGGTDAAGVGGAAGGSHVRPTGPQRARNPHGLIDDEVSSTAAKPVSPCALVSRGEAQRILRAEVERPLLAPQGPTCIYRVRGSKREVTLAVTPATTTTAPPQDRLGHRMRVKVGGRHAFCGVAGVPTLIVPLHGRRLITVAAPCPIAAAFAGRALARLGSN